VRNPNIYIKEVTVVAAVKELVFEPSWCKGCGICVEFCPKSALELVNEKPRLKEVNECILCGLCEQRCPDYALYIKETEV